MNRLFCPCTRPAVATTAPDSRGNTCATRRRIRLEYAPNPTKGGFGNGYGYLASTYRELD